MGFGFWRAGNDFLSIQGLGFNVYSFAVPGPPNTFYLYSRNFIKNAHKPHSSKVAIRYYHQRNNIEHLLVDVTSSAYSLQSATRHSSNDTYTYTYSYTPASWNAGNLVSGINIWTLSPLFHIFHIFHIVLYRPGTNGQASRKGDSASTLVTTLFVYTHVPYD